MAKSSSFVWPAPAWVDLFYDLAMAAAVLAISGSYAADYSLAGGLWFAVTYGVLMCFWAFTGVLTGSFTSEPVKQRSWHMAVLVIQMIALLLLAVSAEENIAQAVVIYDALFGLLLISVLVLGLGTGRMGWRTRIFIVLAIGCLGASWVLPVGYFLAAWICAVALLGVETVLQISDKRIDGARLRHRFGELTVLIIGEVLVKIALTARDETLLAISLPAVLPIMVLLVAMWWAYFLAHRVQSFERGRRLAWVAAHVPLQVGILGLAVGLSKLLVDSDSLYSSWLNLVGGPLVLVMVSLAALHGIAGLASAKAMSVGVVLLLVVLLVGELQAVAPLVLAYLLAAVSLGSTSFAARE
jgi:low temperature requirement protein LtrA